MTDISLLATAALADRLVTASLARELGRLTAAMIKRDFEVAVMSPSASAQLAGSAVRRRRPTSDELAHDGYAALLEQISPDAKGPAITRATLDASPELSAFVEALLPLALEAGRDLMTPDGYLRQADVPLPHIQALTAIASHVAAVLEKARIDQPQSAHSLMIERTIGALVVAKVSPTDRPPVVLEDVLRGRAGDLAHHTDVFNHLLGSKSNAAAHAPARIFHDDPPELVAEKKARAYAGALCSAADARTTTIIHEARILAERATNAEIDMAFMTGNRPTSEIVTEGQLEAPKDAFTATWAQKTLTMLAPEVLVVEARSVGL